MNRDHLGEEGTTGRPNRSCVTRYGTRGPGSQADRNAKTNRHGVLAGDDGASHRRRPSSEKGGNRCAGTGATSWPGPALPNTYDEDNSLQCMTLPNLINPPRRQHTTIRRAHSDRCAAGVHKPQRHATKATHHRSPGSRAPAPTATSATPQVSYYTKRTSSRASPEFIYLGIYLYLWDISTRRPYL